MKPRTVSRQERENDEDMNGMDMTQISMLIDNPKVQIFYIRFMFYIFEEWALHHELCLMSFSEVLAWIKHCVVCSWKVWRLHEVDWGPNQSLP